MHRAASAGLDILVNNAGITRDGLLMRMKEEDWDAVLNVNLKSAYLTCKAARAHPYAVESRGVSSIWLRSLEYAGNAGQANYAASKAGLIGLTKTLAKEFASRGITANAIAPGFIRTEMTAKLKDEVVKEIQSRIGMGRLGEPEEVGRPSSLPCGPRRGLYYRPGVFHRRRTSNVTHWKNHVTHPPSTT